MISGSTVFSQIQNSSLKVNEKLKNSLGVSFGLSDFHVRDELVSPLSYRGTGITGCLEYIRQGKKNLHFVELTAYYDFLETTYSRYEAQNGRIGIRYSYLQQISNLNFLKNDLKTYFGGGIYSFLNISDYKEFISNIGILTTSWYLSHSAELSLLMDYSMGSSSTLFFQVYFPLVSNVSRPSYTSYDVESHKVGIDKLFGEMEPFWKNFTVQLKAGYNYFFNNWLNVFAQYSFQYSSYYEPRNIGLYMNNFRAGLHFLF